MKFPELPDDEATAEDTENDIEFISEDLDFQLDEPEKAKHWILRAVAEEQATLSFVNYIFCSDDYLHQMNVEHLKHNTLTDIITFPYSETTVEGDIFISIDRVRDNAETFKVTFEQELARVMIHGVLHLLGYNDKNSIEKAKMTEKENYYLAKQ